jgi:hypothetical protein
VIDRPAIETLIQTSDVPMANVLRRMLIEIDYLTDIIDGLPHDALRARLYQAEQECLRRLDRINALTDEIYRLRAGVAP